MGEPPPNPPGRDNHGGPFGRGQELLVKEALQIQMTFPEERFNQDGGLEVPFCWTAMKRRRERGTTLTDL